MHLIFLILSLYHSDYHTVTKSFLHCGIDYGRKFIVLCRGYCGEQDTVYQGNLVRKKGMHAIMKQFNAVTKAWAIYCRVRAG